MTLELWVHVIVALVAVTSAVVAAGCTVDAAASARRARQQADRSEDVAAQAARELAAARERRQEAPPAQAYAGSGPSWAPGPAPGCSDPDCYHCQRAAELTGPPVAGAVYRAGPDGGGRWVYP